MRHARRRKLTVEDLNRALRWSNVEVSIFFVVAHDQSDKHAIMSAFFFLISVCFTGDLWLWHPRCFTFPFSERR